MIAYGNKGEHVVFPVVLFVFAQIEVPSILKKYCNRSVVSVVKSEFSSRSLSVSSKILHLYLTKLIIKSL